MRERDTHGLFDHYGRRVWHQSGHMMRQQIASPFLGGREGDGRAASEATMAM